MEVLSGELVECLLPLLWDSKFSEMTLGVRMLCEEHMCMSGRIGELCFGRE